MVQVRYGNVNSILNKILTTILLINVHLLHVVFQGKCGRWWWQFYTIYVGIFYFAPKLGLEFNYFLFCFEVRRVLENNYLGLFYINLLSFANEIVFMHQQKICVLLLLLLRKEILYYCLAKLFS